MYLARNRIRGKTYYRIRESYENQGVLMSRDLFDLGTDPSRFIVYPGGNAYYFHESVEESLKRLGVEPAMEELDDIFWPFLDPTIKRAVEGFRGRQRASRQKIDMERASEIQASVHIFDKRRMHYLRLGLMDQGYIGRMPAKLLVGLTGKSRDEIEQQFMVMEQSLKPSELKNYVYVIFDLQRFFKEMIAKKMPEGLDQQRVDRKFLSELCRLNQNREFWACQPPGAGLHEYLVRYAVMFFDNDFGYSTFLHDYVKDFMNRHRFYRPVQPGKALNFDEAGEVLGLKKEALKTMTRSELSRQYRRLAQKHHPDAGGEHENFVKLTEAYQRLMNSGKYK